MSHGGPTGRPPVLDLGHAVLDEPRFAVVDVTTAAARLRPGVPRTAARQWGIVDVDDCVNAAQWLADQGEVDGDRLVIRGGSAGGYTTLAALTFRDVFAAGASHFGVADAEAWPATRTSSSPATSTA